MAVGPKALNSVEVSGKTTELRHTLPSFCISFGLQRHAFFILRAVSVFYFTSIVLNPDKGQQLHSYFFAALALAPVCVGVFVTTLPRQRRAVYLGEWLLICACTLLSFHMNRYLAGILLVGGIGFFNVSFKTVFGAAMQQVSQDLDACFTWLYLAINVASFFAPLVLWPHR